MSVRMRSSDGLARAAWAWSRIVAAGSDSQGAGLFKIPIDGGAPIRLVSGQVVNPVCSPDGTLIVYDGPVVGGLVPLLGVRPDGTPVDLPKVLARLGGDHRFLNNRALVYVPRAQSPDFWLLDLATKTTRQLTHLSNQGSLNAFDISADGKEIVFDRYRENSDIVLIDLPK